MTQVSWFLAVGFVAMGAVGCSGDDVPVVENGSTGEASGGTGTDAGGSESKGSPAAGASSNGGASGGTKAMGGLAGTGGSNAAGGTVGAAGDDSGPGCQGEPPRCFGSNVQQCCSSASTGTAICEKGGWSCRGAPAPGCNGTQCTGEFDCGSNLRCARSTTYCAVYPAGASAEYACVTIPDQCLVGGASLCSCLKKDSCTDCTEESGAVTLTCAP